MWNAIAGILHLIILTLEWWGSGKPQRDEDNRNEENREDIVAGDADAVTTRLDRLLTKARDRAERGKDS